MIREFLCIHVSSVVLNFYFYSDPKTNWSQGRDQAKRDSKDLMTQHKWDKSISPGIGAPGPPSGARPGGKLTGKHLVAMSLPEEPGWAQCIKTT